MSKTDIIKQLEKGKELLESGEIDVDALKTKIESAGDEKSDKKPKRKRESSKRDNSNNDTVSEDDTGFSDDKCNSDISGDNISAENNNNEPAKISEEKVEKYPGFDFTKMYAVGQTIYYVKVNNIVGEKELQELKLRTVYPKMLVGCLEKAYTQCIGPDTADMIFTNRYDAVQCYDNTVVNQKVYKHSEETEVEEDE